MRDNNEKPPEGGPLLFAFATVFIVIVATRIDTWTADAIAIAFTCYAFAADHRDNKRKS